MTRVDVTIYNRLLNDLRVSRERIADLCKKKVDNERFCEYFARNLDKNQGPYEEAFEVILETEEALRLEFEHRRGLLVLLRKQEKLIQNLT